MYFKNRVDADALNQSPFLSLWFQFSIPHVLVSSPFVVCSAVRMADEDNRSEMNGGPESLLGGADAVKIVFHLSKVCLCCLCAAKSTDASPLSTASSLDRWSGNRPWGKTRTVFDQVSGKSVKVPEGKICLICEQPEADADSIYSQLLEELAGNASTFAVAAPSRPLAGPCPLRWGTVAAGQKAAISYCSNRVLSSWFRLSLAFAVWEGRSSDKWCARNCQQVPSAVTVWGQRPNRFVTRTRQHIPCHHRDGEEGGCVLAMESNDSYCGLSCASNFM